MWAALDATHLRQAALEYHDGILCQRQWIAHEQQRASSAACELERSFRRRSSEWANNNAFCRALLTTMAGRSIFFYGDSLIRDGALFRSRSRPTSPP